MVQSRQTPYACNHTHLEDVTGAKYVGFGQSFCRRTLLMHPDAISLSFFSWAFCLVGTFEAEPEGIPWWEGVRETYDRV